MPSVQLKPVSQSAADEQVDLHVLEFAQTKLLQERGGCTAQSPALSQMLSVSAPELQVEPQTVFGPGYVHAWVFVPSHAPAQVPVPSQAVRVPCGAPVTGEHVPTWSVRSHAWHSPVHVVLQQTPSTQKSEAHSRGSVHAVPVAAARISATKRS